MPVLNLTTSERRDSQILVDNLQAATPQELEVFSALFAEGNEAAWRRFIRGAYNHPITWWIGIFQLQMQMGVWGHQHRGQASVRANITKQASAPFTDELADAPSSGEAPLISNTI